MKLQISIKKTKGKRTLNGNFSAGYLQVIFDQQTKIERESKEAANLKKVMTTFELAPDAKVVAKDLSQKETAKTQNENKESAKKEVPKQDVRFRLPISRNDLAVLNQKGLLANGKMNGKKTEIILESGFAVEFWANPNGHSTLNIAFLNGKQALHLVSKPVSDSKHNLFLNVNEYEKAEKQIIQGFEVIQIIA